MFKEILKVKTVKEIEAILSEANNSFFLDNELESVQYKNTAKSLGARYLIKKSIIDYLCLGDEFKDIEIKNHSNGNPVVQIYGKAKEVIDEKGIKNVQVSISHSRNYISTLVIIE